MVKKSAHWLHRHVIACFIARALPVGFRTENDGCLNNQGTSSSSEGAATPAITLPVDFSQTGTPSRLCNSADDVTVEDELVSQGSGLDRFDWRITEQTKSMESMCSIVLPKQWPFNFCFCFLFLHSIKCSLTLISQAFWDRFSYVSNHS